MSGNIVRRLSVLLLALLAPAAAFAATADLSVLKNDAPDPVAAGADLTYTLEVANEGPDAADDVTLEDTLPAGTTFVSLGSPAGWSCSTPAAGVTGTVSCSVATLPPGGASFVLVVRVDPGVATGTVLSNTVTVTSTTPDPQPGSESSTVTTTVAVAATDLQLVLTDSPDPVTAGLDVTYGITVSNSLTDASGAALSVPLPAGTTFRSLSAPAGWSCSTPAVGSGSGTVLCTAPALPVGDTVFSLTVRVAPSAPAGSTVLANASVTAESGGRPVTASDAEPTTVRAANRVTATKAFAGSRLPGGAVTYTVVITNAGPGAQGDNPGDEFTDVLPAGLTLVSANATSGTAVATVATRTVTWNGALAAGASATVTIAATVNSGLAPGTAISNQGTLSYDADGDGTNETAGATDDPAVGGDTDPTVFLAGSALDIPALGPAGLALLAVLLALGGAWILRRRTA